MFSVKFLKRATLTAMLLLIAVVSFYLFRSPLPQIEFGEIKVLGTDADLQINRVHVVQNEKGAKEWELWADQAKVYQKQDITQMRNLHILFYPKDGKKMNVYAERGVMENRTRNIQLEGNVRILTDDGYIVETESLRFNSEKKYVETKDPVVLRNSTFRLTGTGLFGRTDMGQFTLERNVRAIIQGVDAAAAGGKAPHKALPAQSGAPKKRKG
ncbi:MAG: LPS export ABC transporter periplasmic protein LptC [bacterium]|nr:LPS export ABC transporter periplasmic protein LptC [bacterium]